MAEISKSKFDRAAAWVAVIVSFFAACFWALNLEPVQRVLSERVADRVTWANYASHPLEAVAAVLTAIAIWLQVKGHAATWPIGIVGAAIYAERFWEVDLKADAALQVVYVGLGILGWFWWLKGSENQQPLPITWANKKENTWCVAFAAGFTILVGSYRFAGSGMVAIADALTTGISLGGQFLLMRKKIENWIYWIVANTLYVPLLCYKGYFTSAILYFGLLVMAVLGLQQWRSGLKGE